MDQLPLEIFIIIFSKATLMTLIQCRRVCKSWLAALSDPAVIRSYIKPPKCLLLYSNPNDCSSANSRFLHLYDHRDIPSQHNALLKLAAKATIGTTSLVGHCNGLLCWCRTGTIYISNPLTGESITIPTGADYLDIVGFGYIPNKKQYKLVHLVTKDQRTGEFEAKVQTLGTGIWKCVKCAYRIRPGFGVHANGALHWIDFDGNIRFFDLETERFGILPLPPIAIANPMRSMVVIKDFITVSFKVARRVQTWIMTEYGEGSSWMEFKARGFNKRLRKGLRVRYQRPLIFYPNNKSLILGRPKDYRYQWSFREQNQLQQLYFYEHKRTYSLAAVPFGNIDEAIPRIIFHEVLIYIFSISYITID